MSKRKRGDKLTETFIKGLKEPGTHGDGRGGNGLKIVVKPRSNGELRKSWIQRIRIGDEKPDIGLGTFPVVTLLSARDMATNNRRRVGRGEDIRNAPPTIPTLEEGFEAVIKEREDGWDNEGTKDNWYRALRYCKNISSKPVSEIKPSDVLSVIKPLWHKHPKAARDLRSNVSAVMEWAITNEYRLSNPARPGITKGLGQQPDAVSHPSLAPEQLGGAVAKLRDSNFWWAEKYCLLFMALTCVRSREAREATWAEINFSTRTWTIPASHMKKRKLHQVPLSDQALQILTYARERSDSNESRIFPSERSGKCISGTRLSIITKKLALAFVPHGVRSSFINWAAAQTHIPEPAAEMVLAHAPSKTVIRIYRTADFFQHRCPVMQEWADFLCETMGPVISAIPEVTRKKTMLPGQNPKVLPLRESEYQAIQSVRQSRLQGPPDQETLRGAIAISVTGLMRDALITPQDAVRARWRDLQHEVDGTGRLTIPFPKRIKRKMKGQGNVCFISARTMKDLGEMRTIRHDLGLDVDVTDERIFQICANRIRLYIQKMCADAKIKGLFSGSSPRNGMIWDLRRSGVGIVELRRAKRWKIAASTTHAGHIALATHGAVAKWYAEKETHGAVWYAQEETETETETDGVVKTHLSLENPNPVMQRWVDLLTETQVPVTPGVVA